MIWCIKFWCWSLTYSKLLWQSLSLSCPTRFVYPSLPNFLIVKYRVFSVRRLVYSLSSDVLQGSLVSSTLFPFNDFSVAFVTPMQSSLENFTLHFSPFKSRFASRFLLSCIFLTDMGTVSWWSHQTLIF